MNLPFPTRHKVALKVSFYVVLVQVFTQCQAENKILNRSETLHTALFQSQYEQRMLVKETGNMIKQPTRVLKKLLVIIYLYEMCMYMLVSGHCVWMSMMI